MKYLILIVFSIALQGCASYDYSRTVELGDKMVNATGESLDGKEYEIPKDFSGQLTLLIFGYVQDSQFDIDRWLIGLDMTDTQVPVYEIPTIKGMFPRMFKPFIDEGMRSGIPKEIWKGVITVYEQGDDIQRFTGNQSPRNSRVMLLDENGRVIYFYDRGFSVNALNELREVISEER